VINPTFKVIVGFASCDSNHDDVKNKFGKNSLSIREASLRLCPKIGRELFPPF